MAEDSEEVGLEAAIL